jgi:methyl-accepting chemotaxis protein
MQSKQIIKGPGGGVVVRSDGTILLELGNKDMIFDVCNAATAAQGLLQAVAYVSEQIADAMENAADTVQETKEAVTEMQAQTDRFEKLE